MEQGFSFNVNMYEEIPHGTYTIHHQVDIALERLKLYRIFQQNESLTLSELKEHLKESPFRLLLEHDESEAIQDSRRIDHQSHWTLRIAHSTTQQNIFINNEIRWFKMRFNNMTHKSKMQFMQKNHFVFTPISAFEKFERKLSGDWYKFYFTEVPMLVKMRLYPLEKGFIYIPQHKLVYWLLNRLEYNLKSSFLHIKEMLPLALSHNDQLETILSMIDLNKNSSQRSYHLDRSQLEEKYKYFPLCMKIQYETLQRTHHLKYFSRMQYGLFVKGLGLPLDQALEMWRNEFVQTMPETKFWRKYSYLIKHQYGTVGSKRDYVPYGCAKIQDMGVAPNQVNGCPFKHWDGEILRKRLTTEDGVPDGAVEEIVQLKKKDKYGAACARYFQCVHKCAPGRIIKHPNQYYKAASSCCGVDIEDLFASDDSD